MVKKQSVHLWIITGTLLLVWSALLFRINEPFFGHHEGGNVWISASIRTFNQYGADATNYLPIRTPGPTSPETGQYYLHHPPLIVWFSAIATQLFGFYPDTLAPYELSIRMVGIIATLLTLPLFYILARRLTTPKIALVGFMIYSVAPVTIYFGRMPYYDMLMMPAVLAFTYVFMNWMQEYTTRRTINLTLLGILTMWIAWAGAFYFFVLGIIALIYGNRKQRIGIIVIGVVTGLATVTIPLIYAVLNEETMQQLLEILKLRTSNVEKGVDSETFTLGEFTVQYLAHMFSMISIGATFLGIIGLGILLKRKKTFETVVILGLAIAPLIFMLIVRNSFHFHDWYKLHFLPSFAIATAIVIVQGWHIEPDNVIKRYIKPFIVAIVICSIGANLYAIFLFHQTTSNDFFRDVASELPQLTEETDFISSNVPFPYSQIEYYAYRNINWGVAPTLVEEFYHEEETVDMHYLLCLTSGTVETYTGLFSEYPYEIVADECRLIHLTK